MIILRKVANLLPYVAIVQDAELEIKKIWYAIEKIIEHYYKKFFKDNLITEKRENNRYLE